MYIHEIPQGINVVIETDDLVYIGRFRETQATPGVVRLQDCAIHQTKGEETPENFVRHTAKYGVDVAKKDVLLKAGSVLRVRALKDVPKPD